MEPAQISFTGQERSLLKSLQIEAVILFGSRATGNAGLTSDYDFGILTKIGAAKKSDEKKKIYDAIYDLLSSKIKQLVNIDIVFLKEMPMELQMHAAKRGIALFEKSSNVFANFKEEAMEKYADFAPLRQMFHKAILDRIPL